MIYLDTSIHLASIEFLRARGQEIRLASWDRRLNDAAAALGIQSFEGLRPDL